MKIEGKKGPNKKETIATNTSIDCKAAMYCNFGFRFNTALGYQKPQ